LTPKIEETPQDYGFLIGKTLGGDEGAAEMLGTGVSLSRTTVTEQALKSQLEEIGPIILEPGETLERVITVKQGIKATPEPITFVFESLQRPVAQQEIETEAITGSAVDADPEKGILDIYIVVVPGSRTEQTERVVLPGGAGVPAEAPRGVPERNAITPPSASFSEREDVTNEELSQVTAAAVFNVDAAPSKMESIRNNARDNGGENAINEENVPDDAVIDITEKDVNDSNEPSSAPTAAAIFDRYDDDRVEDLYFVEVNINNFPNPRREALRGFPLRLSPAFLFMKFWWGPKTLFNDIYGPYRVTRDERFIFAQQLKYNPEEFLGDHVVIIRVFKNEDLITENAFEVELSKPAGTIPVNGDMRADEQPQEAVEQETTVLSGTPMRDKVVTQSSTKGKNALTGAVVSDGTVRSVSRKTGMLILFGVLLSVILSLAARKYSFPVKIEVSSSHHQEHARQEDAVSYSSPLSAGDKGRELTKLQQQLDNIDTILKQLKN
jgi:hypothetical protein